MLTTVSDSRIVAVTLPTDTQLSETCTVAEALFSSAYTENDRMARNRIKIFFIFLNDYLFLLT